MGSETQTGNDSTLCSPSQCHSPGERDLQRIAEEVPPKEWKRVGRKLGVRETELDAIEMNHVNVEEQTIQMLLRWKTTAENATFQALSDCLAGIRITTLTKKIKEIAKEYDGPIGGPNDDTEPDCPQGLTSEDQSSPCNIGTTTPGKTDPEGEDKSLDVISDDNTLLEFSHVWPYSCLLYIKHKIPFLRPLIMLVLAVVVLVQLCIIFYTTIFVYGNRSHPLYCHNLVYLVISILFRLFTRCALPLILISAVADILDHKLDRMTLPPEQKGFLKEIKRKESEGVLRTWAKHFWNKPDEKNNHFSILQSVHSRLGIELQVMCLSSVIECVLLSLIFHVIGATYYQPQYETVFPNLPTILFTIDSISFPIMTCSSGIAFSFFFHELTIKHLVSCGLELEGIEVTEHVTKLTKAAKKVVGHYETNWTLLELFIHFCIYFYSIILLVCSFALQPLGCLQRQDIADNTHLHWLCFVLVFFMAHLFATTIRLSRRGAARYRCIGIALEVFIFVFYFSSSEHIPMFGQFLHIMYGIIPAGYLFAYLWGEIYHEYRLVLYRSRQRMAHFSKLVKDLFQFLFLLFSLVASISSEWYLLYKQDQVN